MTAIDITNLCKSYKAKKAVNGLSLSIDEGELFALLGVNGAGKTTTIKMLAGLSVPTSGEINILGHNLEEQAKFVKRYLSISPQETAVVPMLTVRENLLLVAQLYEFKKEDAVLKANEIIKEFGFEEIQKQKAKTLSGGWQRRLSIAMALISNPKLLFLDEPTLGLDVLARRELWHEIEKLKGKVTVILTTHYLEEAVALSDRIGIMANGKLNAVGTATELIEKTGSQTFEDAFVAIVEKGGEAK